MVNTTTPGTNTTTPGATRLQNRVNVLNITSSTKVSKRRFTTTGRVVPPAGSNAAAVCKGGAVILQFKSANTVLFLKRVNLASDCSFTNSVTLSAKRLKGVKRLRVSPRFEGSDALLARNGKSQKVTVR